MLSLTIPKYQGEISSIQELGTLRPLSGRGLTTLVLKKYPLPSRSSRGFFWPCLEAFVTFGFPTNPPAKCHGTHPPLQIATQQFFRRSSSTLQHSRQQAEGGTCSKNRSHHPHLPVQGRTIRVSGTGLSTKQLAPHKPHPPGPRPFLRSHLMPGGTGETSALAPAPPSSSSGALNAGYFPPRAPTAALRYRSCYCCRRRRTGALPAPARHLTLRCRTGEAENAYETLERFRSSERTKAGGFSWLPLGVGTEERPRSLLLALLPRCSLLGLDSSCYAFLKRVATRLVLVLPPAPGWLAGRQANRQQRQFHGLLEYAPEGSRGSDCAPSKTPSNLGDE